MWNALRSYPWPGNVRELRNQLESMVIQDQDGVLDLDDMQEGEPLKTWPPAARARRQGRITSSAVR